MFCCALLLFLLGLAPQIDEQAPDVEQLMRTAAASYAKADYDAARTAYEKAWDLAQQTPSNDPLRYDLLKRLVAVRAAQGEFAEADKYMQLAINWRETAIGRDDPKIADDLVESANLCRGLKDYDRALAILERVRAMHAKVSGDISLPVASDFSRIAKIYLDQKNRESAVDALDTAVKIRSKVSGEYDASLLPDLDRLGEVRVMLQRYEDAETAFRRALIIRESLVGRDSGDLIQSIDGLAYALFGQKKYDEADPLYQRLIALWVGSVGKDHPMVALAYDKVAVFYADQKKFEQAKAAADHANALRAHFLATGLVQEATEQQAEANLDQAAALYHRALATLDPPDPEYDELRAQIETILKALEQPAPKRKALPAPPRRK